MNTQSAEAAEQEFFTALIEADVATLGRVLADDFVMIDVMRGGEIGKPDLLGALSAGMLTFDSIVAHDPRVREYGDTAIVTGWTEMRMTFGGQSAEVKSRYTHVFVRRNGAWVFVSAQGTPIVS